MENLRGTFGYYKGVKKFVALFFCSFVLLEVLALYFPKFLGTIASFVYEGGAEKEIIVRGILVVAYVIIILIINFLTEYFGAVCTDHFAKNLRQELFEKVQKAPTEKVNELGSGRILAMIMNDTNWMKNYAKRLIVVAIKFPITVVGGLYMIFSLNIYYAVFAFSCIPLFILFLFIKSRKLKKYIIKSVDVFDTMHFNVKEGIIGAKEIRVFNKAKQREKEFSKLAELHRSQQVNTDKSFYLSDSVHMLFFTVVTAIIIIYGVSSGNVTEATHLITLTVTLQYLDQIRDSLKDVFKWLVDYIPRTRLARQRLASIYNLPSEKKDVNTISLHADINQISTDSPLEFSSLSYRYPNGMYGLHNVNLTVEAGSRVAVAGGIGSGKNIIQRMLLKYLKPASGKVLVGGMDTENVNSNFLRKNIFSVCLPNPEFMPGTMRDNLKILNPEATDEEILITLKSIGADKFISKFDDFLNYEISERSNISESAKNLLNIARALLKPASIYVFNQCFDHIKNDSILKLMNKLKKEKKTCLFISYHHVVCKNCNKIYVMKGGKVSGTGTHEQLLKSSSDYQEFYASATGQIVGEESAVEKSTEVSNLSDNSVSELTTLGGEK